VIEAPTDKAVSSRSVTTARQSEIQSMKKFLAVCGMTFAFSAQAMHPVEFEQARAAADEVASIAARYRMCKVEDIEQLRSAYLDHAQKCNASEADIARLEKEYDERVAFHGKELQAKKFSCKDAPAVATEKTAKLAKKIHDIDC